MINTSINISINLLIFYELDNIIVIKNNVPECILISPEDYLNLIEKIEDAKLYEMAQERIAQDNGKRYSQKQIMEEFGISEDDLNEEEIEFE